MLPRPTPGFVPSRVWFYSLAGVVAVETSLLAGMAFRKPSPPPEAVSVQTASAGVSLAGPSIVPGPPSFAAPADDREEADAPELKRDPLARALGTHSRLRRAHRFEDLGASLSKGDPAEALRVLQGLARADRLAFVRGMFDTLAQGNRLAAIRAAREITDPQERKTALVALLSSWHEERDELSQRVRFNNNRFGPEASLGLELLEGDPLDAEAVLQWAQLLTTDQGRAALLGGLAGKLARTDPARTLAYGQGLTGNERRVFNENLLWGLPGDWIRDHPQEVLNWSRTSADPNLIREAGEAVFGNWGERDAAAAMAAATSLAPGPERDTALHAVASRVAERDTAAVDAWEQSLSGHDREVVNAAVGALTPVGIGASLQPDAEGNFVVSSLLDSAPAALSGQVHPGDRLVGVVRSDGTLLSITGMDLSRVVNLVRGAPDSAVQLQFAPAQAGGGFAPPTTVTLIRQRLKRG